MIIALRKQIEIRDTNLNTLSVNHWLVTGVNHRVDKEKVIITIEGYTNRQSRLDGDNPIVKNVRFKIENTYDENNNIVTNDYNQFSRYVSATADAKHKDFLKEAVLQYLATLPDFSDAVSD